ncbi:MCP four helix bundle domain-containing protein [Undibacterium jejuense]|uniref:MCP four helix bundle domain-containing protein n=1 Tax=Undibacterium jejuense TaxID=1344949 RepID=A0A923HG44_9BURK|nr:methyl-accepting chemotaxis protein [Undibacterium jejuense]MBC3860987.1 MCP four helix bundle domain-containing protein [Undibacterium jejuense]
MTIAKRLYLLVLFAAAAMVTLASLGVYQIYRVYDAADYANINTVPSLRELALVSDAIANIRVKTWQALASTDPEAKKSVRAGIPAEKTVVESVLNKYEKENISDDKDKGLLAEDRSSIAAYYAISEKVLNADAEGKHEEALQEMLSKQDVIKKMSTDLEAHREYNIKLGSDGADEAKKILSSAVWLASVIGVIGILAVAFMGLSLVRKLVNSLNQAIVVAKGVAAGDLTQKIDASGSDEVAQLLGAIKEMSDSLERICTQIRQGTDAIAVASTEIATGNMDLSSRTEQQAGALEETASSMEELTSTVRQNSDNARQANTLASTASTVAVDGGAVVSQVVETMAAINESSRKIVDIISVIDGIAFQTNILALNAAVEAARAGEQGRGFAVVAAEVRNLAQRSASAAKEIKTLIDNSVEKVDSGTRLVDQAGAAMTNIVSSIQKVSAVVSEISNASHEQSSGIDQINQAVIHMDESTQQNAALVEQAAAAASSLQDQANKLTQVVSVFKLNSSGGGGGLHQRHHTASSQMATSVESSTAAKPAPRPAPKPAPKTRPAAPALSATTSTKSTKAEADDWEEF